MPDILTENELKKIKQLLKETSTHPVNLSNYNMQKAEEECNEYLNNKSKNINDISSQAIYLIISKLNEEEQINFFKQNIAYIKEKEEEIFLYNYLSPCSLPYYLSLNVLKEIKKTDKEFTKKIITKTNEHIFNGYKHEDYVEFYNYFYEEIKEIPNQKFINNIYPHNRCCYDNITDIYEAIQNQEKYNKEFIELIINKYQDKISKFNKNELVNFLNYIDDINVFKEFINNNYERLNIAFKEIDEQELSNLLDKTSYQKQNILIKKFYENIIEKHDANKLFFNLPPNIILEVYNKDNKNFKEIKLKDWIDLCSEKKSFNNDFKKILDAFDIEEIASLYTQKNHLNAKYYYETSALEYVEKKYRDNIKTNGIIEEIDENTSILSYKYLKNLKELKIKLKDKTISKDSPIYKKHLNIFIAYLKNNNIISNIEEKDIKIIEQLFYKIIKNHPLVILYKISNIEEIALVNRIGDLEFDSKHFTIEQIKKYNTKHHKQLCNLLNPASIASKTLALKLMFIIGFNNAKKILELDNNLTTLEHLIGNINIKNIKLDDQGNPILNTKIMNLLFNDKFSKIKEMLSNKDSNLYTYFPRIFNEWEYIKMYNKDKSLKQILDFLQTDNIILSPKHYRLEGLFKYIGSNTKIVDETLLLHDEILKRESSTIPRIKGTKDEYTYEILKLDDMNSLCLGNQTNCCFTVLGNGYQCLKHATTNKNGRILVIKKNNQILAHSWLWRNGDLLCVDNIEMSKTTNKVDFLHIYLELFKQILNESYQKEGIDSCIKNITIGFSKLDKPIIGIEEYPCIISEKCNNDKEYLNKIGPNNQVLDKLPQPLDYQKYSDSKNVQYLIVGNGNFKSFDPIINYQDEQEEALYYTKDKEYTKEYLTKIIKKINALRYIKNEQTNNIKEFKTIDINNLSKAYCNDYEYIIEYKNGIKEQFNIKEQTLLQKPLTKKLTKNK